MDQIIQIQIQLQVVMDKIQLSEILLLKVAAAVAVTKTTAMQAVQVAEEAEMVVLMVHLTVQLNKVLHACLDQGCGT